MQMEEARGFVFQALREGGWNQFGTLLDSVGILKAKSQKITIMSSYQGGRQYLAEPEMNLIREIVWSLIVQGILIPGQNDMSQSWPFLSLTEYGQKMCAGRSDIAARSRWISTGFSP